MVNSELWTTNVSETLVLVPVGGLFAKRGSLGARDAGSPRLVSSGGRGRNDGNCSGWKLA